MREREPAPNLKRHDSTPPMLRCSGPEYESCKSLQRTDDKQCDLQAQFANFVSKVWGRHVVRWKGVPVCHAFRISRQYGQGVNASEIQGGDHNFQSAPRAPRAANAPALSPTGIQAHHSFAGNWARRERTEQKGFKVGPLKPNRP